MFKVWFCLKWINNKNSLKQEFSDSAKVALASDIHASKLVRDASELAL